MRPEFDSRDAPRSSAPTHLRASGEDGAREAIHLFAISAPEPAAFRSDAMSLKLDHVTIGTFTATEHSATRAPQTQPPPGRRTLTAIVVVQGVSTVSRDADSFELGPGSLVLFSNDMELAYRTTGTIRMMQASIGEEHLPPHVLDRKSLRTGPLKDSRLVRGFAVFLRQLCSDATEAPTVEAPYLGRALADLLLALIAQATDEALDERGAEGLRYRIVDHIDHNLVDPALGPQQIASALGVSVRYVHLAFNTSGDSVAKYIRNRRLEGVARALHTQFRPQRAGDLSEQFGFGGRDQLARAFRAKYGMTLRQYQAQTHDD